MWIDRLFDRVSRKASGGLKGSALGFLWVSGDSSFRSLLRGERIAAGAFNIRVTISGAASRRREQP
jgi:hypothetical protein